MSTPNHVVLFQRRFAPLVESGAKLQTIRLPRKRTIHAGDTLSLRTWTGAPYRSKQRPLRTATCTAVRPIVIDSYWNDDETARADGFEDARSCSTGCRSPTACPRHSIPSAES